MVDVPHIWLVDAHPERNRRRNHLNIPHHPFVLTIQLLLLTPLSVIKIAFYPSVVEGQTHFFAVFSGKTVDDPTLIFMEFLNGLDYFLQGLC